MYIHYILLYPLCVLYFQFLHFNKYKCTKKKLYIALLNMCLVNRHRAAIVVVDVVNKRRYKKIYAARLTKVANENKKKKNK